MKLAWCLCRSPSLAAVRGQDGGAITKARSAWERRRRAAASRYGNALVRNHERRDPGLIEPRNTKGSCNENIPLLESDQLDIGWWRARPPARHSWASGGRRPN